MPQVTRPQNDDSRNADSDGPASTDAASASSTELNDAPYALPIGIQSWLIELSFEPIMVWDWRSGIVAWNQGCEQLYGYSRSDSPGRTSHELLRTRFPQPLAEIEQAIERHGLWSGELRHLTRAGLEIIVESRWQLTRIGERKFVLETNRVPLGVCSNINRIWNSIEHRAARGCCLEPIAMPPLLW